ncbi:MAG: hypothetical protein ABFC65_07175 [Rectinema sp.]
MKAFVRSAHRAALKRALWASLLSTAVMLAGAEEAVTSRSDQSAAGLWFDIAPLVELTNRPVLSTSDKVSAEDLEWFYARPAIATLGFQMRTGPLFAVMSVELQQDVGELLLGGSLTNLPVSYNWNSLCFANNYPNVGFLEGEEQGWHFSLGRRAINLGPGDYSLTVSGQNPWYDHAMGGLSAMLGSGLLNYDFLAINVLSRSDDGKYLFMHRIQAEFPLWSLGFSEYNLLTKDSLDFQDIGPFLIYHHLFSSGSNVMAQLDAELRPAPDFRLYGEVLMDDFQLTTESSSSNPNAFGFHAGLEWAILPASDYARPHVFRKDYGISIGSSHLQGELLASLEWYWASTYLYRRSSSALNEAYFSRYFLQTNSSIGWQTVEPWFSYPLGPDRMMFSARLAYAKSRMAVSWRTYFMILGVESGETTYQAPYADNWFGPQSPVTYAVHTDVSFDYVVRHSTLLRSAVSLDWKSSAGNPVYGISLVVVQRLSVGVTE